MSFGIPFKIAAIITGIISLIGYYKWATSPTTQLMEIHDELEQARYDREIEHLEYLERLDEMNTNISDSNRRKKQTTINYNIDARSVHLNTDKVKTFNKPIENYPDEYDLDSMDLDFSGDEILTCPYCKISIHVESVNEYLFQHNGKCPNCKKIISDNDSLDTLNSDW